MKNNVKIFLGLALVIILGIGYYFSSMIYYLNRSFLTFKGGFSSKSIIESKENGMYIGEYRAENDFAKLNDGSVLNIKDAWVEHEYRYKKILFYFIHIKQKTKGFYLVIPSLQSSSKSKQDSKELVYSLSLHKEDEKYTSNPGISFSDFLGYQIYLNMLPDKIRIDVIQKENENDTWDNAKVVDTINYTKAF